MNIMDWLTEIRFFTKTIPCSRHVHSSNLKSLQKSYKLWTLRKDRGGQEPQGVAAFGRFRHDAKNG